MSDRMRWRYGDTNPVVAAVDAATVIEIGDLVYQDTDDAKPASAQTDQGSEATNQATAGRQVPGRGDAAEPLGRHRRRSAWPPPASSSSTAPAARSNSERLVGADENAAGNALLNQQVDAVASAARAIGRVAKRVASASTSVLVDIRSTVMTGGIEGSIPSGV